MNWLIALAVAFMPNLYFYDATENVTTEELQQLHTNVVERFDKVGIHFAGGVTAEHPPLGNRDIIVYFTDVSIPTQFGIDMQPIHRLYHPPGKLEYVALKDAVTFPYDTSTAANNIGVISFFKEDLESRIVHEVAHGLGADHISEEGYCMSEHNMNDHKKENCTFHPNSVKKMHAFLRDTVGKTKEEMIAHRDASWDE